MKTSKMPTTSMLPFSDKALITLLPYPDFEACASCLDKQRLARQCQDARMILEALLGRANTAKRLDQPGVAMWKGCEKALALYGIAMCSRSSSSAIRDNLRTWFVYQVDPGTTGAAFVKMPRWLGHKDVHASHRSYLIKHSPAFYGKLGWLDGPDLPLRLPASTDTGETAPS
jgi:hypothetical protein